MSKTSARSPLLVGGQQVEEQGAPARPRAAPAATAVAGAQPAAPAAVGEGDQAVRAGGHVEDAVERPVRARHRDAHVGRHPGRPIQEGEHLLVLDLVEAAVGLSHRPERGGDVEADQVVDVAAQLGGGLSRTPPARPAPPSGRRGPGPPGRRRSRWRRSRRRRRRPGPRGPRSERRGRPGRRRRTRSSSSARPCASSAAQRLAGEPGARDDVGVEHEHPVLADGAGRELGLEGHAELADQDHVERGVQPPRDLEGDGHPAAGEAEDDGVGVPVALEGLTASRRPASARSSNITAGHLPGWGSDPFTLCPTAALR